MLLIHISQIPPDGLVVNDELAPAAVHVEGEETFALAPAGRLDCRVDKVDGVSVHVRGRLKAGLEMACSRCLDAFSFPVDQELDLFYLPHARDAAREEEEVDVELKDRDMVVAYYQGETLDLGEMIREQFFLAAPVKPLCREACKGRCPSCGANRNEAVCACPPAESNADVRLLELKKIFDARSH
jgi:DUF177 domain-containing protein